MNVATCPKCGLHSITVDTTDEVKWNDQDEELSIDYPMTCGDCGAVLVLHAVATALEVATP